MIVLACCFVRESKSDQEKIEMTENGGSLVEAAPAQASLPCMPNLRTNAQSRHRSVTPPTQAATHRHPKGENGKQYNPLRRNQTQACLLYAQEAQMNHIVSPLVKLASNSTQYVEGTNIPTFTTDASEKAIPIPEPVCLNEMDDNEEDRTKHLTGHPKWLSSLILVQVEIVVVVVAAAALSLSLSLLVLNERVGQGFGGWNTRHGEADL